MDKNKKTKLINEYRLSIIVFGLLFLSIDLYLLFDNLMVDRLILSKFFMLFVFYTFGVISINDNYQSKNKIKSILICVLTPVIPVFIGIVDFLKLSELVQIDI